MKLVYTFSPRGFKGPPDEQLPTFSMELSLTWKKSKYYYTKNEVVL